MKRFAIIFAILTAFSAMTFAGCGDKNKADTEPTGISLKEPTVTIKESVTYSFRQMTSTTKESATKPTKPTTKKQPTAPKTQPTTKYVAPTTKYIEPTTQYVAPTTIYIEPETEYIPPQNPGYISYSDSSSRKLNASDVAGLSADDIQTAINDIYAHNGYIFKTPSIRAYYESQSWYNGTEKSESAVEASFNSYERYNKDFLAQYR